MEVAKKLAKDYQDLTSERTEFHMEGLKPAINNLLHMYLPNDVTMKEAETIALVINQMIWNPYDFVRNEETTP